MADIKLNSSRPRFISMSYQEIISSLVNGLVYMDPLEGIAVVTGMLSVWFAKNENILVYPTGIISVLIFVYILAHNKLYGDMGINAYYFIMSVYGWYNWTRKDNGSHVVHISKSSFKENVYSFLIFLLFFIILIIVLKGYTDSDVPLIDSFTTALFFVAMILMARKKIENWIAWIIGDLISVPLYFYKGLVLTSIQFLVFLGLAIAGYISWKNSMAGRKNQN